MNAICVASLFLIALAQAVTAYPYEYTRYCKKNTEICVNLRCSTTALKERVPFSYHYSCCNVVGIGERTAVPKLFDEKKFSCVRYQFRNGSSKTVVQKCDPCSEFMCADGQCIRKNWKCNDIKDCLDGSDEVGCGHCGKTQFYCRRADQCIKASRVCDKINDCLDGSDEIGCPTTLGYRCATGSYRCANNKCIPWHKACDGRDDCLDNSDEAGNCGYYTDKYTGKRDEISGFPKNLLKNRKTVGEKAVDAAQGTVIG